MVDLNISTMAWGLPLKVLAQIYVVLVVFRPYKMAHLTVQQRSYFLKVIGKTHSYVETQRKLPYHFQEHLFPVKAGGNKVQCEKVWSTWYCQKLA